MDVDTKIKESGQPDSAEQTTIKCGRHMDTADQPVTVVVDKPSKAAGKVGEKDVEHSADGGDVPWEAAAVKVVSTAENGVEYILVDDDYDPQAEKVH